MSPLFAAVLAGDISISSCLTEPTNGISDGIEIYSPELEPDWVFAVDGFGDQFCGPVTDFLLPISPEQFLVCSGLLEQAAANQGVTCGPPA